MRIILLPANGKNEIQFSIKITISLFLLFDSTDATNYANDKDNEIETKAFTITNLMRPLDGFNFN